MTDNPYIFDATAATFQQAVIDRSHETAVLVDFWAEWCGPCRTLAPILTEIVDSYAGALWLAKVDTDAEQALAAEHGIRSLPTVRLYRNGAPVTEFMGVQPAGQIRALLEPHIPRQSDQGLADIQALLDQGNLEGAVVALEAAHSEDPSNPRLLQALVQTSVSAGKLDRAQELLKGLQGDEADATWVRAVKARLLFASIVQTARPVDELQTQLEADPVDHQSRYELSAQFALTGNLEGAMDELLALMKASRAFEDDAARKGLLAMFDLLGPEHPLVATYRQRLASALH